MAVILRVDLPSVGVFQSQLATALHTQVIQRLRQLTMDAENWTRRELRLYLESHRTYASLVDGRLRLELGLGNIDLINQVIDSAIRGVRAIFVQRGNNYSRIAGHITIQIFNNLAAESAHYQGSFYHSVNSKGRSTLIPWLDWLLFRGQSRLTIASYTFVPNHPSSRTGGGLMIYPQTRAARRNRPSLSTARHNFRRRVGGYRIPPEFAGTASDNWFIDAAEQTTQALRYYLEQSLLEF